MYVVQWNIFWEKSKIILVILYYRFALCVKIISVTLHFLIWFDNQKKIWFGISTFFFSVIKIVLQFCKENSLHQTFQTLQSECQVSLNTVDSVETFVSDINGGRWDAILPQVAQLKLPRNKLEDLYEQARHLWLNFMSILPFTLYNYVSLVSF